MESPHRQECSKHSWRWKLLLSQCKPANLPHRNPSRTNTSDCYSKFNKLSEHFIESNIDQSWIQYLQNMQRLGTWADHIIIQEVANSHNLRIHITKSAPNLSKHTIVSSIFANEPGGNARDIYIGHLDEMH